MRRAGVIGLAAVMVMAVVACGEAEPEGPPTLTEYPPNILEVGRPYNTVLSTSVGRMTFTLLDTEAPLAVNSFLFLATNGYYDDITFHRVIAGVLAETGDPTGTGSGNAGYTFEIEAPQRPYERGMLAMANAGTPNSNGSRFFIILGDVTANGDLPADYTVFGLMKEDHAPSERTLAAIEAVPVAAGPDGEMSMPQDEIKLVSVQAISGCRPGSSYGAC